MIELVLNGEQIEVESRDLASMLIECGYDHNHLATALNGTFIHREMRSKTQLDSGDRVEVVSPIEGG